MNKNHRRALLLNAFAIALLVVACGGGAGGDDGNGGTGSNCQAIGCDGGGGTGAGGTTTTTGGGGTGAGGGGVCHPTAENGNCAGEDSCECLPTDTTEDSWCVNWENICPSDADVCMPGHNQCGYDLPKGQDYVPPDPTCMGYVDGDMWSGQYGQDYVQDFADENGLLHVGFGALFVGEAGYYSNFVMSGRVFYWNRANASGFESGEGEISADCKSITVDFYYAGETAPYATFTIGWVHQ